MGRHNPCTLLLWACFITAGSLVVQFGDASNVRAVLDVRERMMKGDCPSRSALGCRNTNYLSGCSVLACFGCPSLLHHNSMYTTDVSFLGECGTGLREVPHEERCRAADYGHPKDRKLSDELMDLLDRIFVVDPEQRITLAGIQVRNSDTL